MLPMITPADKIRTTIKMIVIKAILNILEIIMKVRVHRVNDNLRKVDYTVI
jgi:hypothetical protein